MFYYRTWRGWRLCDPGSFFVLKNCGWANRVAGRGRERKLSEIQVLQGLHSRQLITEMPTLWGSRQQRREWVLEQHRATCSYPVKYWGAWSPESGEISSWVYRCSVRAGLCHLVICPSSAPTFQISHPGMQWRRWSSWQIHLICHYGLREWKVCRPINSWPVGIICWFMI